LSKAIAECGKSSQIFDASGFGVLFDRQIGNPLSFTKSYTAQHFICGKPKHIHCILYFNFSTLISISPCLQTQSPYRAKAVQQIHRQRVAMEFNEKTTALTQQLRIKSRRTQSLMVMCKSLAVALAKGYQQHLLVDLATSALHASSGTPTKLVKSASRR
jgi:hypothetical protein